MLKNSKAVLLLSPYKVGQAGNILILLRIYTHKLGHCIQQQLAAVRVTGMSYVYFVF